MKQLSIFTSWIDYKLQQPKDGEKFLHYYVIEDPEDSISQNAHLQYDDRTLVGPIVGTYRRKFYEDGTYRTPAFWQPIEPLPAIAGDRT